MQKMAALVQVEDLLDRRPSEMSGGQQQRIALARALVKEPQLLLLDEPLSNLDASLRLTMRGEIRRLQRSLGVTTILVTHDQIEATTMADRIICMSKGRIEQIGTADTSTSARTACSSRASSARRRSTCSPARPTGTASASARSACPFENAAPGRVTLGIRPEAVALGKRAWPRGSRTSSPTAARPSTICARRSVRSARSRPEPPASASATRSQDRARPGLRSTAGGSAIRRGSTPHEPRLPRLKWHMLRRRRGDPPFFRRNLVAGLEAGAALEVDLVVTADGHFLCLHDLTLDAETTGTGPLLRRPAPT